MESSILNEPWPLVMFTNSPATFQTMINDIFEELITEGHVVVYLDNILIFTKNSPATFQTMINDIFEELITEGHVVVYLDNILIFTKTIDKHRVITQQVSRDSAEAQTLSPHGQV